MQSRRIINRHVDNTLYFTDIQHRSKPFEHLNHQHKQLANIVINNIFKTSTHNINCNMQQPIDINTDIFITELQNIWEIFDNNNSNNTVTDLSQLENDQPISSSPSSPLLHSISPTDTSPISTTTTISNENYNSLEGLPEGEIWFSKLLGRLIQAILVQFMTRDGLEPTIFNLIQCMCHDVL